MIVQDWRDLSVDALKPLYERERRRWWNALQWDTTDTWSHVERARVTWGLPGLAAVDQVGRVCGWTFYVASEHRFDIGGIVAETPAITCLLLNGIMDAAHAARVDQVACFTCEGAPGLALELARRDFAVDPFLYLARPLAAGSSTSVTRPPSLPPSRGWRAEDVEPAAVLLRASYDAGGARHFIPTDTPHEWRRYVRNLIEQTACGALLPDATRVLAIDGHLAGLVLVTTVGPGTAHVAQVAVEPVLRGGGIGEWLLRDACAHAYQQRFTSVTLLVAAANDPARTLYNKLGFAAQGAFVSGIHTASQSRVTAQSA